MKRIELVDRRKNKGLTLGQLATKACISRSHYGFIESGSRNPSYEVALKIASALDTSIDLIFPNEIFFANHCYNMKHNTNVASNNSDSSQEAS